LKPEFTAERGIYKFQWEDGIQIQLDRFQEKSGTLSAEITIRLPKASRHLHQARLNLQSTRARNELARHLEEIKEETLWVDYLEQVCTLAIQKYREGEPLVRLGEGEIEPPRYLLYPVIPENQPTVIFGDGGVGKSTTANLFAILASAPWNDNPFGIGVNDKSNTLYLDWETDKSAADWNVKRLSRGLNKKSDYMFYRRCELPLGIDLPEIQKHILEVDANFVIIDSALAACGGDPSSPEVTGQYFRDLRQLKVTSLTLAHNSKNSTGEKTIYGSVFWSNFARSVWELKKNQETETDVIDVGLFCRKANLSKLFNPIGLRYTYSNGKIEVERHEISDNPSLASSLPIWIQLTNELKRGAMQIPELADSLGVSEAVIRTTLNRNKERFIKVTTGWALRAREEKLAGI